MEQAAFGIMAYKLMQAFLQTMVAQGQLSAEGTAEIINLAGQDAITAAPQHAADLEKIRNLLLQGNAQAAQATQAASQNQPR